MRSEAETMEYFNPRPPHRGRPPALRIMSALWNFNPRPPHRGRPFLPLRQRHCQYISTHAPRTGGDLCLCCGLFFPQEFQPTPPAQGATCSRRGLATREKFQPTPPAQGATKGFILLFKGIKISTHAPRTGGDLHPGGSGGSLPISTHAPRTGGDEPEGFILASRQHFNPRPPHRGRRLVYPHVGDT